MSLGGEDKILVVSQNGFLKTIAPELTTHFSDDMIVLEKWVPKKPLSVVYFDGKKKSILQKDFWLKTKIRKRCSFQKIRGLF